MTELIVALDGPSNQYALACDLIEHADVRWFKIGPQLMCSYDWQEFTHSAKGFPEEIKIFLDLKLADTADTIHAAIRRFIDAGISAVSTFTKAATTAAMEIFEDPEYTCQIWQVLMLSDKSHSQSFSEICNSAHGIICPGYAGMCLSREQYPTIIVPGVRLETHSNHGHKHTITPQVCSYANITYAVVGRPIWNAHDPVSMAKLYKAALESHH